MADTEEFRCQKELFQHITDDNVVEMRKMLDDKKNGMSALQHACYMKRVGMVKELLLHGADVNDNRHKSGYTALMFAALSGDLEVTRTILEAGANASTENSIGRTAAQMAGFVGQSQVVSLINNFFSRDDLEYFTQVQGFETEPKLPPALCSPLYQLILNNNLHPVKICLLLDERQSLLHPCVPRLLHLLVEKSMKSSDANEVMAFKFHYLASLLDKLLQSEEDSPTTHLIKHMLRANDSGIEINQEQFVRDVLKSFPYTDSMLFQQMVRTLSKVKMGDDPSGLSTLTGALNGTRFANEDDNPCGACASLRAPKRCTSCKWTHYCDQRCQKLHWFVHKKHCKELAVKYEEWVESKKREEEAEKKRQAEDAERAKLNANNTEQQQSDQLVSTMTEKATTEE